MVQDSMLRTIRRQAQRIAELEAERDELNAAFTSLSGLVMEQDPDKWEVWTQRRDPAAAELQRERKMNGEMSK
jgi:hypothetical protein